MAHCFGAAGCRLLLQSPAAVSRRISTRRMLELQRFAAVDSGCHGRLQLLCGSRIALLPFVTMLHGQQQELLRVFDSVREAADRAFQRRRSGCERRRLWRVVRAGVRPCARASLSSASRRESVHACMDACNLNLTGLV